MGIVGRNCGGACGVEGQLWGSYVRLEFLLGVKAQFLWVVVGFGGRSRRGLGL